MRRARPLVPCRSRTGAKARGNLLCVPGQAPPWCARWLAGARPSLVSCVVRTGEPQRTGSLSGSPGCRVNQQQLGTCSARSIITARGLALHCIERTGRDGRRGAVAAGLVCLSRPCWGGRRGRRRRGCPRSTATPGRAAEAGAPSSLFARPCRGSLGSPSPHRLARATVGHGRRPGRCVHCTHTDGSSSGDFVCLVGLGRYSLVPPCEGTGGRVAFVEWGTWGFVQCSVCVSDTYVYIYTYIY